jgi:hypothetical protein
MPETPLLDELFKNADKSAGWTQPSNRLKF